VDDWALKGVCYIMYNIIKKETRNFRKKLNHKEVLTSFYVKVNQTPASRDTVLARAISPTRILGMIFLRDAI